MQILRYMEEENDEKRSNLINKGVFKPTSDNIAKNLGV